MLQKDTRHITSARRARQIQKTAREQQRFSLSGSGVDLRLGDVAQKNLLVGCGPVAARDRPRLFSQRGSTLCIAFGKLKPRLRQQITDGRLLLDKKAHQRFYGRKVAGAQ